MKAVPFVDMEGNYIEDLLVPDEVIGIINRVKLSEDAPGVDGYVVGYPVPTGLYKPKLDVDRLKEEYETDDGMRWYDGADPEKAKSYWIEGLTPEEIKEITKDEPMSELEKFKKKTSDDIAALWEFNLFGGAQ